LAAVIVVAGVPGALSAEEARHEVTELEITILSTMLSERAIGEWGFAALVEADGRKILFDTGNKPDTVLENARQLGLDLTDVEEVILSHNHGDHTGGLVALRGALMASNPDALSRAHVARGIFWERLGRGSNYEQMTVRKAGYESLGGRFVEHDEAVEIHPGIWLTGPVPRVHAEKNYGNPSRPDYARRQVRSPEGPVEDNIPESMSMVINTPRGLVVLSGCGHAGMVNTLEYARSIVRPAPVHAAIGGYHLLHADDETLDWTAGKLVDIGVENFVGAHCTGIEPVYRFRELVDLGRGHSTVGAVGGRFTLDDGVSATALTR
jgi:7,8-dihydropterin-6-yl-methyl-4-(beta-D-ribofuranosyl)aminobenzene 5'-phosphate synthase